MLKTYAHRLTIIAMLFSASAYSADQASETNVQPASTEKSVSLADQLVRNPAAVLPTRIQADTMGYLSAVVQNPTDVTVTNVFIVVMHINEETGQPDKQSNPIRVTNKLMPGYAASVKIPSIQVYKKADFDRYKAIVVRAEPIR